ncbi:hypothetical protein [Streptomyces swartbergensis]|uniref:hypothetical protein n=1 Tax=Streptomyces swartbergensis TaxID=487165 RepID=UPI00117E6A98|nr:hypothetical protein [Streptomyces swartbergensis]
MTTIEPLDQSIQRISQWIRSQPLVAPLNTPASEADITAVHPVLKYTETDYPRPCAPSMARLLHALAAALHGTQNEPELPFWGRTVSVTDGVIEWS